MNEWAQNGQGHIPPHSDRLESPPPPPPPPPPQAIHVSSDIQLKDDPNLTEHLLLEREDPVPVYRL